MAFSLSEFDAYWPDWPEGAQGNTLVDISVGCSFNHLIDLLWGDGSHFQEQADQARGFIEFVATQWTENVEDLPSLPGGFDWSLDDVNEEPENVGKSPINKDPLDFTNKMRKVRFHNRGGAALLGQFFKNEELQRCREFDQNHKMVVEACVCTTAPYCDRFRVICRYSVETLHDNACSLKIEFHIAYIKNVNSMTKVFMEKGAKGGLQKNFEIFVESLGTFVPLLRPEDAINENEAGLSASSSSLPPTVQDTNASNFGGRPSFFNWQSFTAQRFSDCIEPRVSNLYFQLKEKSISLIPKSALTSKLIARAISALLFLLLVKFVLVVARNVWTLFCVEDLERTVLHPLLYFLDIPDSLAEVVTAVLIIEAAHWLMEALGNFLFGSERPPIENQEVLKDSQELSQSIPQFVLSTRHSMPAISDNQSQENGTVISEQMSPPSLGKSDPEAKNEGQPLPLSSQLDSPSDVADEPSFIDNTVSFFKLGMVTAALGVELAISGMTKNRQTDTGESGAEKGSEADGIAPNESPPNQVLEEVFENERLQPFRGWGHTWPGHFLPTDKCGHWSVKHPSGRGVTTSMNFEEVEPHCPDEWTWGESEWQVDRTGEDIEAVDKDGWQYDFDFAWIKFPAEAGKGKKHMKIVRRRRWIRTRSRLEGTSSSCKGSEPGFTLPNVTDIMDRRPSIRTEHKARSELSYFVSPAVSKLAGCSAPEAVEKSSASASGALHRRHSSSVAIDRFFSIEENCFSRRTQPQDHIEDSLQLGQEEPSTAVGDCEQPIKDQNYQILAERPSLVVQSMGELGASMFTKFKTTTKALSESGAIGSKFMRRTGSSRSQPSAQTREKYAARLDLPSFDNDGQRHQTSSPQDSDDESLESNELNWTSMDGGKWVIECLGSKSSRSGSPGSPANPPKGLSQ